ncbi:MAG: P1 family peptidase [Thalassovita sp.]
MTVPPKPGALNLITDIQGLKVGNASDAALKSGSTVLIGDTPFVAGMHVMGGAPGTRDSDLLAPDKTVEQIDALVLSGGSLFGLDAASGVADELRTQGRGFTIGDQNVPIVPAAILFDLLNNGDKTWQDNPYKSLGIQALHAAQVHFDLGSHGAGTGATTANLKGGLGSASVVLPSGHTVGALVAVNPVGSVVVAQGPHFWAAPFEQNREFGAQGPATRYPEAHLPPTKLTPQGNTTIGIVATDAALTKAQCTRLATAAHDGIARAVVPAHTPLDGDLIYGLSTGARPFEDPMIDTLYLGHAAATCMARAIARAIYAATPAPSDLLDTWQSRFG